MRTEGGLGATLNKLLPQYSCAQLNYDMHSVRSPLRKRVYVSKMAKENTPVRFLLFIHG